jgi:hypothetical protein
MKLLLVIVAMLLTGCVKQIRGTVLPPMSLTAPTVRITAPRDGQRVSAGQTVLITATLTDNIQLEKVHLFVTSRAGGAQVLHLEKYLDGKSYNLSESFTPAAGSMYTIKIVAADLNNNNTETQVGVTCN